MSETTPSVQAPKKGGLQTWQIILIIVAAILGGAAVAYVVITTRNGSKLYYTEDPAKAEPQGPVVFENERETTWTDWNGRKRTRVTHRKIRSG